MAESSPSAAAHPAVASLDREIWRRLLRAVQQVATSEIGGKVRWLFAAILALLVGISGLNVINSYVGRDLVTAIEHRNLANFFSEAGLWLLVFVALTVSAVLLRYTEEWLA